MENTVNWQQIDTDDYKATEGDYFLRAEQMNKKYWWWCVYFNGEEIGASYHSLKIARTKDTALKAAEKCYQKHLQSQLK